MCVHGLRMKSSQGVNQGIANAFADRETRIVLHEGHRSGVSAKERGVA